MKALESLIELQESFTECVEKDAESKQRLKEYKKQHASLVSNLDGFESSGNPLEGQIAEIHE